MKNPAARIKVDGKTVKKPTVVVGVPVALTGVSAPKNSAITFKSSDESVATVSADGTLTPLKAGTVNIAATNSLGAKYVINVTVKKYALQSVKQTRLDAIEAVIAGDISGLKNEDVLITCKETNVIVRAKSVSIDSSDKTKVAISTYGTMANGMHYTVKIDGIEKEFTATDNVVAGVSVSPLQIAAGNVGTEVVGQTVDKNGVILNEVYLDGTGSNNNVTFNVKVNATDGYTREKVLVLYKAGNKATAEITYHTYKYENGAEVGVITKTFDIVAVDQLVTTSEYGYTVVKGINTTPDYKAPKTQVPVGDLDMYAHFKFLSSNNTDVTANYTVETSDRTTLMVADGTAAKATEKVHVVGIKEGSAYINVKDVNGNIVKSLPVTVVAARKLARVQLGTSNVVISNDDLTDAKYKNKTNTGWQSVTSTTVKVEGYDQYGDSIKVNVKEIKDITGNAPGNLVTNSTKTGSSDIVVDGSKSLSAGNYSYRLTVADGNNVSQLYSFNVRVVDPKPLSEADLNDVNARGGRVNYRLVVTPRSKDVTITSGTTKNTCEETIHAMIGVYESEALIGYLPIEEGSWDNVPGSITKALDYENSLFKLETITITSGSSIATVSGSSIIPAKGENLDIQRAIQAGTHRVNVWAKLKLNGANSKEEKVEFYDDIAITDSANGAVITKWRVSRFSLAGTGVPSFDKNTNSAIMQRVAAKAISDCLDVSCLGKSAENFYVDANDITVTNNAIFIKKAYVVKEIGGVNYAVPFTINLTFTVQ